MFGAQSESARLLPRSLASSAAGRGIGSPYRQPAPTERERHR